MKYWLFHERIVLNRIRQSLQNNRVDRQRTMDAGFFKGTSTEQDRRFADKDARLLKSIKFPAEFEQKVDMRKVNLQVIRPWIAKRVVELVGIEDEIVVEYAMGLLEDKNTRVCPLTLSATRFDES